MENHCFVRRYTSTDRGVHSPPSAIQHRNFERRTDNSFADDLNARPSIVRHRVALLRRLVEILLAADLNCFFNETPPYLLTCALPSGMSGFASNPRRGVRIEPSVPSLGGAPGPRKAPPETPPKESPHVAASQMAWSPHTRRRTQPDLSTSQPPSPQREASRLLRGEPELFTTLGWESFSNHLHLSTQPRSTLPRAGFTNLGHLRKGGCESTRIT